MNEAKPIYLSVTFWGTAIGLLATFLPMQIAYVFCVIGVTDQTTLPAHIVGLIGAGIAIYGRLRARKIVTLTGKPPAGEPLKRY
jgi:hypothetical protein